MGESVPSDLAPYLNYGVLGVVVLGIFLGWIWPKPAVEKIIQERDRLIEQVNKLETERDAAVKIAQDQIIPLLTTFVQTTNILIPLLQDMVRETEREKRRQP